MKFGFLFQPTALWVGAHYSDFNRRWCVNVLPCLTVWVCRKDGSPPAKAQQPSPVALYHRRRNQ